MTIVFLHIVLVPFDFPTEVRCVSFLLCHIYPATRSLFWTLGFKLCLHLHDINPALQPILSFLYPVIRIEINAWHMTSKHSCHCAPAIYNAFWVKYNCTIIYLIFLSRVYIFLHRSVLPWMIHLYPHNGQWYHFPLRWKTIRLCDLPQLTCHRVQGFLYLPMMWSFSLN